MKKVLIAGSVLAALVVGGTYIHGLQNVANNMVVEKSFSFVVTSKDPLLNTIPYSFLLTVNVTIKNPTRDSLKLNLPFVQLYANKEGAAFATSEAINKQFEVPALGTVTLDPIKIPFTLTSLSSVAAELYKNVINKQPLGIWIKTTTYVNNTFKDEKFEFQQFKLV